MKLIVAMVFEIMMGPSSKPSIRLSQRFSEYWSSIDEPRYENGLYVHFIVSALLSVMFIDLIMIIRHQLKEF